MKQRRQLIDTGHDLSVRRQCLVLSVTRSSLYYAPKGEKPENLEIMRIMDEHCLKHPTEGVIRIQDMLFALGFVVNHKPEGGREEPTKLVNRAEFAKANLLKVRK